MDKSPETSIPIRTYLSTFGAMVRKELITMARYPVNFVATFAQVFLIVTEQPHDIVDGPPRQRPALPGVKQGHGPFVPVRRAQVLPQRTGGGAPLLSPPLRGVRILGSAR